jgi:hypothetical protein
VNFVITGLPRSATAWLANWFTTDHSVCWHEALMDHSMEELLGFESDELFGISETSLCTMDPLAVNALPVPKLVIHRPLDEVNRSLVDLGFPPGMTEEHEKNLWDIGGFHLKFEDIFDEDKFRVAHEWLIPIEFNPDRYALLRKFMVENKDAVARCLEMVE